jgi:diacylglycerol kinase family enzyme
VAMEIDGDVYGETPVRFTVCPKAARIVSLG